MVSGTFLHVENIILSGSVMEKKFLIRLQNDSSVIGIIISSQNLCSILSFSVRL